MAVQEKQGASQTVGEVADHALKLLAIETDDHETPERQAAAKDAIDKTLELSSVWATSGDQALTKAWIKLQRTVQLNRNANPRTRVELPPEPETFLGTLDTMEGPLGSMRQSSIKLFNDGSRDDLTAEEVSGAPLFERDEQGAAIGRSRVDPLFDEGTRKRSALFDSYAAARSSEILGRPLEKRDDGTRFVKLSNGEEVNLPNLGPDQQLHITLDNGETQDVKVDSEFLSNLADSKHGGPITGTILGGTLNWINGKPQKVWTAFGERYVPKITGNAAIDREIFLKPEYQRAFEGAAVDQPWWKKTLGAAYQVGEFAGLVALTHKAGGAIGGLADTLGATDAMTTRGMGALGALTAKTLGSAVAEGGGRSALALAGTNFDMTQIGEQVYYNSVAGLANGEVDPSKWVKSGVELGVAGYALGGVARAGRRAIAAGMESGAFDTAISKISLGKWDDTQIEAWSKRFAADDAPYISASMKAMNEARTGTVRSVQQAATDGFYGEFGRRASREALGHIADAGFVGYQFGAWHGAQARAARDGKNWDDLGWGEKASYFAKEWPLSSTGLAEAAGMIGSQAGFLVAKLHGGAQALVGLGGDEARQQLGKASMTPEQQKGVDDFAQHLVRQIRMEGSSPDVATAADAFFGGITTDESREGYVKEQLNQLRGETADIAVDRAATFEGSHLKTMLTAVDKDGGEDRLREALKRATPAELDGLRQRLRLDPDSHSVERLRQATSLREWTEQEQVRRVEEMEYPVPPEGPPDERQGPKDERPPRLSPDAGPEDVAATYRPEVRHEQADQEPTKVAGFQRFVADVPRGTVTVREFVDKNGRLNWALTLPGEEDNAHLFPHTEAGLAEAQRLGLVGGGEMAPRALDLQSLGLDKMPPLTEREKADVELGPKSKIEQSLEAVSKLSDRRAKQIAAFQVGERGPVTPDVTTDAKTLIDGLREDNARRDAAVERIVGKFTRGVGMDEKRRQAQEGRSRAAAATELEAARTGVEAALEAEKAARQPNRFEVADAERAIGEHLGDVPAYAALPKGERSARWLPLEAYSDRRILRQRVAEARQLAQEARRRVGVEGEQRVVDRSRHGKAARAASVKPKSTVDATPLFTDPRLAPFADTGRALARPGRGGTQEALRGAMIASNDVTLRIAANDPLATQQKHALIAGAILGAGTGAKSPLFLAVLGVTAKEVETVRDALVQSGASMDPHITDAMEGILTPGQQAYAPTRELLRLIALGADATPHGRSEVLSGEGVAKWADTWWKTIGRAAAIETALSSGARLEEATNSVEAMWKQRMSDLRSAASVRGASIRDPFTTLAGRVAVAYGLGDYYSTALDTKAPGGTLGELTSLIVDRLQGRSDMPIPMPGAEKVPEAPSVITMPMAVGLWHSAHSTSKAVREGMEGLGIDPGSPEETAFLRTLASGGVPEQMQGWSEAGVEAFRAFAVKLSAQSRAAVKAAVAINSPAAAEAVDLVLDGLSSEAKGEGVQPGVLDRLAALGFEKLIDRKTGTIAQSAEHQLARLAQVSLGELGGAAAAQAGRPGTPSPEPGMTRLYRFNVTGAPDAPIPEWMRGTPEHASIAEATGRWFTDDPAEAQWYAAHHEGKGHTTFVDVPTAEAERHRVSNLSSGEGTPRSFSRRPEKEFFLPKSLAVQHQPYREGGTTISLYSGFGVEHVKDTLRIATALLDYSMGFRDRLMNNPVHMADVDAYAPHALSPKRLLDSVVAGDAWWETKAGKSMQPFMAKFLEGWQKFNPLYRGKRGLASEDVRNANVKWHDSRIDAAAVTHDLHFQVQRIGNAMAAARLSNLERQIVGRSIAANEAVRIRDRSEWEAMPGRAGTGYLFDFVCDWNHQLVRICDEMTSLGLLEPEAAAHLRAHYFPRKVLDFAWGSEGMPEIYFSGGERKGPVLASSEFERGPSTDYRNQQRTYDAGFVLPLSVARAAKRIELFRTLQLAIRDGSVVDRSTFEGMGALEQAQRTRSASKGPNSLTMEESLGMSPAERDAEVAARSKANVHQLMLQQFVEDERQSRGGEGQPPMTPALARMLDTLEHGYVSHHVSNELALLIEQTELGGGSSGAVGATEVAAKWVQDMTRNWKQLRTIQNPKHWAMQFITNAFTNAATGKVGLGDLLSSILTGEGTYADASEHATAYYKWVENGKREVDSTPEVKQFEEFARLIGGHTIAQMIAEPVRPGQVEFRTPEGLPLFTPPEGLDLDNSTTAKNYGAFMAAVDRTGREHFALHEKINRYLGTPSPVMRSEAVRSLLGVYNLHELYWKYAAYLEGLKKGLSPKAAAHWGAEGTGDFSDRNPTLLRLSTFFAPERGRIRRLAEQRAGTSTTKRMVGTLLQSGIGSPFWMYRASMMPALARSHATWKGIAAVAGASLLIRAISQAAGGHDDDLAQAIAGKDTFYGMGLDSEAVTILARRYGDSPMPGFAGGGYPREMRSTIGEWAQLWKAWGENALHTASLGTIGDNRPDASMLTTARGPTMGGQSSYLDLGQLMPIEDLTTMLANEGKAQPQAGDYSVGFMPAAVIGSVSDMWNASTGNKGKTKASKIVELASKVASTWSAPFGGGAVGVLGSREGQEALRTFTFDGRSVSEIVDGLPATSRSRGIGDLLSTVATRSVLPSRRVTAYPAATYEQSTGEKIAGFFGWRPGEATPGDDETAAFAERKNQIRGAALNMLSQAYKDFLDYRTVPYEMTWVRMFDLNRDLVRGEGGQLDVTENPSTEFGKWLRSRGDNADDRRPWVQESIEALRRQRGQLLPLLAGADGLVRRKDVDPALHDRITRAAWDGQDQPDRLMRVLYRMMQDEKDSGGAVARMWLEARIPSIGGRLKADDREVWIKGNRWVKDHMPDAPAEYDLRQTLGPQLFDVAPTRAIHSLPLKSREEMAAQFTRAFGR